MIETAIKNQDLRFHTSSEVFSPSSIDKGTLAMLSVVAIESTDKLLDLGCGYGVVGITASKLIGTENVVMCDVSDEALKLSRMNAELNGVSKVKIVKSFGLNSIEDRDFTLILSNPPYHTDFSVAKNFIEKGFQKLANGGKLIMVTKRREWYKNKLISTFGGVKIHEIEGYYVFVSEKRAVSKPKKQKKSPGLSKKLQRKLNKSNKRKNHD